LLDDPIFQGYFFKYFKTKNYETFVMIKDKDKIKFLIELYFFVNIIYFITFNYIINIYLYTYLIVI